MSELLKLSSDHEARGEQGGRMLQQQQEPTADVAGRVAASPPTDLSVGGGSETGGTASGGIEHHGRSASGGV